jgi:sortase A
MKLIPRILIGFGELCIFAGIVIVFMTFFPVIKEEVAYTQYILTHTTAAQQDLKPIDTEFGIVIPKLGANAHVIANVDPYIPAIYQQALTRGVAHAKGTALPGDPGNIFLFSHSSVNFYTATVYNSVFYLIHKLERNDEIFLYYNNVKYVYRVDEIIFADPKSVSYLSGKTKEQTLTLMTCWPPGTTLQRLLVITKISP